VKSDTALPPGEGFFFSNPGGDTTVTFVGEVPQGNLASTIGPLYGFYSSIVPQSTGLTTIGFPSANDMIFTRWSAMSQSYFGALTYFDVGDPAVNGWYDGDTKVDPTPNVAEAFLLYNPGGAAQWTRTFSVN
jgi:hypothetical protein